MLLLHAGGHGIGARKLGVAVADPLLQVRQGNRGPCTVATITHTPYMQMQAARASMQLSCCICRDCAHPLRRAHARTHTRTQAGGEKTSEITLSGGEQVVHPA